MEEKTKYCKHCGQIIDYDCVVCPKCGKQVEELKTDDKIIINNSASAAASASAVTPVYTGRMVKKWPAFFLCLFLGFLGAHKFYEGKTGMGILYLLTLGLCCIGWIIDIIVILCKPDPYYV